MKDDGCARPVSDDSISRMSMSTIFDGGATIKLRPKNKTSPSDITKVSIPPYYSRWRALAAINCVFCLCAATHIVMIKVLFDFFLCYHHRDRWLDICQSGTTTKVQPIIRRRSTCARISSRRDTSWTTTTARASTGTSGSTARRAAAIWKSFPVPVAIITLAEADVSGWRDGSCSIGSRGPCPITDTGPTIGRTQSISERAPPRPTRKLRRGCRSVFRWVCVFGNFPEDFSIHHRRNLRCTFLHRSYLLYRVYLSKWIRIY